MRTGMLNPLFFFIAKATHHELARQIQFLKVENEILRARLPKRIVTTKAERARLLRFGQPLGSAIAALISIVSPRTFTRWVNDETPLPRNPHPPTRSRPRTAKEIQELVIRIAQETGFGYTRILGELRKLGIDNICRSTVKNIFDRHGLEPTSSRRDGTWDQFVRSHAESLWGCDFFTKNVLTSKGLKVFYVLGPLKNAPCDLIILDEFGYIRLNRHGAEHLFGFFSQCYEQVSLIITTNLPFTDWPQIFADDERMTGALLDRLRHHVNIVALEGDSFRLKTAIAIKQKEDAWFG